MTFSRMSLINRFRHDSVRVKQSICEKMGIKKAIVKSSRNDLEMDFTAMPQSFSCNYFAWDLWTDNKLSFCYVHVKVFLKLSEDILWLAEFSRLHLSFRNSFYFEAEKSEIKIMSALGMQFFCLVLLATFILLLEIKVKVRTCTWNSYLENLWACGLTTTLSCCYHSSCLCTELEEESFSTYQMNINWVERTTFISFSFRIASYAIKSWKLKTYQCLILLKMSQGQEKWSSVRITDSKKNSIKVENHVSIHSNLNLNGLCPEREQKGLGKEVKLSNQSIICSLFIAHRT